ncbi:MAG: F0F1 ATP synthase subunit A [Bdellovibrionaceae bacterium]|nr:F0F1 ATP synthase subunit A [Pseudobdellovibrionaceae bacterium]
MVHFNWTQLIPSVGHDYIHIATALVAGLLLILISLVARAALGTNEKAIAPANKFSIKGFFEVFIEAIAGISDMVIGKEGRKFVPMFATIFLYIWFNNLIGLLPGMTAATDNINTTVAVGLFSFVAYNAYGIKEHGVAYLKHFMGPLLWLAPLMFIIEIIGHIVRPMSLGLRLQGNMTGDHTVLSIFLDLAPFPFVNETLLAALPIPVIFYFLGMFVCTMQAFVFTMLSMIYVSMAISHDH